MKRDITQPLIEWKLRKNRKPLLLRGARQVGKTYAVEHFAKENFGSYIKINMEERSDLKSLFRNKQPKTILDELSVLFNTNIEQGKTLFFIDEIQSCPEAIVSLRYFYEQLPAMHVMAAGSLLDHTLNEMKLPMPVGRIEFLHMHPMSFNEFLEASGEHKALAYMANFSIKNEVSEVLHKKLLNLFRYYIFIGGMPEAVKIFTETQNLMDVARVHHSILLSLQYDFAKYGSRSQQEQLLKVLKYIGRNPVNKIKYVNIDREVRSIYIKEAIKKLELSRIIHLVKHCNSNGVPMSKHINEDIFKAIFLDIGLSNSMNKIQLTDPLNILTINEGALAEQFIGQELLTMQPAFQEPELYYWTREEKSADAEVDYLFQHKNKIYPIEVKAGKTGRLKSLHVYLFEKKINTGIRFNADVPSYGAFTTKVQSGNKTGVINYNLLSLPMYLIHQAPRLIDSVL